YLYQELRRQLTDALKKAAYLFARQQTDVELPHYLALGPRGLTDAVRAGDAHLGAVESSFECLIQRTPVNAEAAWQKFEASGFTIGPDFQCRPLNADPELLKPSLFDVPVERIEDPA